MSLRAKGSLWLAAVLVGALLLGASAGALAQQCAAPAARVVSIQGSLELRPHNAKQWQAAQTGLAICSGDSVRVGPRSRAALLLPNETTLRLDQGTTLTLSAPDQAQASLLDLILGTIHVISRTPRPFRVNTPYLNAGVEGTEFLVGSSETSARLAVFEGRVSATTADSSLMLVGGEIAYAAKGVPLRKERMLRPADAVQWALYYPTLFDHRLGEQIAGTPGEAALRESLAIYRQDRLAEAIFRLDKAPEGLANPRFLTYRAGLLLLVGRADEARSDIERALAVDAGNSTAHALKSVVALTQNDKDQALTLATQAVELDQASPVARLALSYAQQAHFKIEEALASVQKAVDLDPQNALAWARLAELHMSTGYLDRALEAAKRAASLNPEVAKTQSVLGFANLTRIDTQAAKLAFQKAIDLDQADPLPRLGLGLAMIREGDLTAGRAQLEIAVCLDPENSLLRSYVGKAYYEEKRDKLAGIQFELAKARDPRDPTPWFYDAIRKQTENRPVEALDDVDRSIDLNNNRAVFRSRFLLDRDLAARDAVLARIYDDLGFEHRAILEASNSLREDPSNYSAHRLLADIYSRLDRREIARVSELLQTQLMQPINTNPVQPRLAFTDLNLPSRHGLADLTFNEYSSLFEREETRMSSSALVGNHSTRGDQLSITGLNGRLSYSIGQFHYGTDGFRPNNDLKHDVYQVFAQFAATPSMNVQAEFVKRDVEHGDVSLKFDPNIFSARDRESMTQDSARLGARVSLSPNSIGLLSWIRTRRHGEADRYLTGFPDIHEKIGSRADVAEMQYITAYDRSNFVAGAGHTKVRTDSSFTFDFSQVAGLSCIPSFDCNRTSSATTRSSNQYLYATLKGVPGWLATVGLSHDSFEEPVLRLRSWNPKFGLQWTPIDAITLRIARFNTLKRELVTDQTVEPTNVVGFNQLFDDFNGTRTRQLGFGADVRISGWVVGGMEMSRRTLSVPAFGQSSVTFKSQRERTANAYIDSTPRPDLTLSAKYEWERFDQQSESTTGSPLKLRTSAIPMTVRYFAPTGYFGSLRVTLVRQEVKRIQGSVFPSGTEGFCLVDLIFGYRLGSRRGVVSVEVSNLLDRRFFLQDDNFRTSEARFARFAPTRSAILRANINF